LLEPVSLKSPAGQGRVAVVAASAEQAERAAELADELDLPLLDSGTDPRTCPVPALLLVDPLGLCLQKTGRGAPGPVRADFGGTAMRHRRRSGHNELLGKAVGVGKRSPLRVLDATAGLGRDSFVLADLGCEVLMCEREPMLHALLLEALEALHNGQDAWLVAVGERLSLRNADSRNLPQSLLSQLDVIYLDPMFPDRDKSAAVKKEMALFHELLLDDAPADDAELLLAWALQQPVRRVVVKRPPRAPLLGDRQPGHQLRGKAIRYDVYSLGSWD
jgi:16S rRNA (guanine1516-N2)-methyltransferase